MAGRVEYDDHREAHFEITHTFWFGVSTSLFRLRRVSIWFIVSFIA